jgi:hypothetical protein
MRLDIVCCREYQAKVMAGEPQFLANRKISRNETAAAKSIPGTCAATSASSASAGSPPSQYSSQLQL